MFSDISEKDRQALLICLNAIIRSYSRGEYIMRDGESADRVGYLNTGSALIERMDYWGNRTIWSRIQSGETFGEAFAFSGIETMPVSVYAAEDCEVILLDCSRILTTCTNACEFHSRVVRNITRLLAVRNVQLSRKLEHLTERSTREKLLSFLSEQAKIAGTNKFTIPYNRQELADYLAVERSAMSAELSRMSSDGLLAYNRSQFELLRNE